MQIEGYYSFEGTIKHLKKKDVHLKHLAVITSVQPQRHDG
jgi:hypothetical protein